MSRLYLGHTLLLCILLVSLTFNKHVYPPLHATALLSVVLLVCSWPRLLSWRLWLPVGFMAWVALVPGELFADLPLATTMLAAYLCGLGISARPHPAGVAPENSGVAALTVPMLLLLALNGLGLVYALYSQNPKFFWNNRLSLFFDHPNVLGYVAGWGALYGLVRCRTASRRTVPLWLGLSGMSCMVVVVAGARGVYFGLGLGIVAMLLLLYRTHALKILSAAVLAAVLVGSFLPAQQQARVYSALSSPLSDHTIRMRLPIWMAALEGFRTAPLTGQGLRSFADHHELFVAEKRFELEAITSVWEERVANPHNLYLGLLYAYGLGGFALLLLAVGPAVVSTVRAGWARSCGSDAAFFLASLCFLLGSGTVDYSLHRKDGILILFLTLGLVSTPEPSQKG